jgi:DNA-binding transcriptional MerR regulator
VAVDAHLPRARHARLSLRTSQVTRLVGVTHRQLDYWARTNLVVPSKSHVEDPSLGRLYSFGDVVQLKMVRLLLEAGLSLKRIYGALEILKVHLDSDEDLSDATLLSDGETAYLARGADEVMDLLQRGRGVIGIAVGPVVEDLATEAENVSSLVDPGAQSDRPLSGGSYGFIDRLTTILNDRMTQTEATWRAVGETLSSLGDAETLAGRLMSSVPQPSEWDERAGPFYTTRAVCERLGGISRQAVLERRRRGSILGLKTADGVWVYPTWQFLDDGRLRPGLRDVLGPFAERGIDGWEVAAWLESTSKDLGGASPRNYLLTMGEAGLLTTMARDAAMRLAA